MADELRASLLERVVSKLIDLILIFALMEVLPRAGWFAGMGYLLISDGLFDGRSLGKRLIGLRVMGKDAMPCSIRESILRNSLLTLGLLMWKLPFLGWLLLGLVTCLEFIVLLGSNEGKRIGDEIAKTTVIESRRVRTTNVHI